MKQTVSYQMGDDLSVKGAIPFSYDKFVFEDLVDNFVFKKSNLDVHYQHVMSSIGNSYKGVNKYGYGNTIVALKTIVDCKKNHTRRTEACKEAVAFLHQDMQMSPRSIQEILLLLEVKMSIGQILKSSNQVFAEKPAPAWIQRFMGGNL